MDVDTPRLDLGVVSAVHAESFGEPGQRTFRLLAETHDGTVSLWLEKEQIVMVGNAIEELLRRTPESHDHSLTLTEGAFRGELEVRAGSLAIGYDPELDAYSIEASDFVTAFELASIAMLARRSDFEGLAEEIASIVAGSRPRCPLCHSPLAGQTPHFCPPSNGHTQSHTSG